MINCEDKFKDDTTLVRVLQANQPYTGNVSGRFSGAFFKFEMTENETIYFTMRLQPKTSQGINVAFTLYRKSGTVYTNLGTSTSDEFYNSFSYAATPAEYYICITSDWDIDYTLEADFTDYPFVLIADCDAYGGEYMPPTEFARKESLCDSPVFYQIIEGSLPSGLEFSSDGLIHGIPLEQDCEPAADGMPPSFTWWDEDDETKTRASYGVEHRIVVRAALVDSPDTYDDREFFVCVHNNWDFDRDHFMGQKANWERPVYIAPEDAPMIDVNPPEPTQPFELVSACPPVYKPVPVQATLSELKELAKMVEISNEYAGLVKINSDGLCEVCEPDEVDDKVQLVDIQSYTIELCTPCPEPVVVTGLKPIPQTLCPVKAEHIPIPVTKPELILGIPELCYPELLNSMMSDKVCSVRSSCPPTPIYPPMYSLKNKKPTLQSQCSPCKD